MAAEAATQPNPNRGQLIRALQAARAGTTVICYVTSTRAGLESQMAMDVIEVVYDHMRQWRGRKNVDLFLHTNGGEGIVPWRLVSLIREHALKFSVLVPHRAFSAGTLVALGADEVVMHPMGMLGPIDPTVTTPFNPVNPQDPNGRLGISVEDVASYIALVRDDVGIRHEDELVQAFKILAENVNPLALGTVKRTTSQSRMMGEKLLRHDGGLDARAISEVVEKLASQLYYHGHPISRREAREDLGLSFVKDAPPKVARAMWSLYSSFSEAMRLDQAFNAVTEVTGGLLPDPPILTPGAPAPPPTIVRGQLGPYSTVVIETAVRQDAYQICLDAMVLRDWNGQVNTTITPYGQGWVQTR